MEVILFSLKLRLIEHIKLYDLRIFTEITICIKRMTESESMMFD